MISTVSNLPCDRSLQNKLFTLMAKVEERLLNDCLIRFVVLVDCHARKDA